MKFKLSKPLMTIALSGILSTVSVAAYATCHVKSGNGCDISVGAQKIQPIDISFFPSEGNYKCTFTSSDEKALKHVLVMNAWAVQHVGSAKLEKPNRPIGNNAIDVTATTRGDKQTYIHASFFNSLTPPLNTMKFTINCAYVGPSSSSDANTQ